MSLWALLLIGSADAGELPFVGERLEWEVRYAGLSAGSAWAEARAVDGHVQLEAGCRNASWYDAIYTVNDWVRSTWSPGHGSRRYETRFREGSFHQDQDMHLRADGVEVWRNQERDGAWRESTSHYAAVPDAEDPVSALYVLRTLEGDGPWEFTVWNGKKALHVTVAPGQETTLETAFGPLPARPVSLNVPHEGQVEQKGTFTVWLGDDPRHLPLRAELKANVGSFRADLVGYRPAAGSPTNAANRGAP